MTPILKEVDFETVQLLYGFVLIALAILLATQLIGNILAITAVVCLLLLKDGAPNFIMGVKGISSRKLDKPGVKSE